MTAPMRFLSVCSGIEAASVAWEPLGWKAAAFAEIDPFASAVLAHHYPDVPNLGDMTRYQEWPDLGPIDIVCGGTPCQAFSVAGLRAGLADPRGNLALTFLAIVDRYRPKWVVWENVPGVLSSNGGRDFASFLGGLGQLGYGWCFRVLDAQYVRVDGFPRAVPQRRRRVWVVGYLGDWRRAAAVLSEPESVLGDTPPRRTAGEGSAADVAPSLVSSGRGVERTGETRGQDPVVAVAPTLRAGGNRTGGDRPPGTDVDTVETLISLALGGGNTSGPIEAAACLTAKGHRSDFEVETFVAHTLTNAASKGATEDGTGRGTPIVPVAFDTYNQTVSEDGATQTLCSRGDTPGGNAHLVPAVQHGYAVRRLTPVECSRLMGFPSVVEFQENEMTRDELIVAALAAGYVTTDPATGKVFCTRGGQGSWLPEPKEVGTVGKGGYLVTSIRVGGVRKQVYMHRIVWIAANGVPPEGMVVDHINNDKTDNRLSNLQIMTPEQNSSKAKNDGLYEFDDHPRHKTTVEMRRKIYHDYAAGGVTYTQLAERYGVTRGRIGQIVREQDYLSSVTWRGKCPPPDGPMYKALGNSWAVNVARWVGQRIQMVEEIAAELELQGAAE